MGGVEPLVVIGHDARRLEAALEPLNVRTVDNPAYQDGMLTSVRCGIRALEDHPGGALVHPVDQPAVRASTFTAIRVNAESAPSTLAVATHEGRRGHPLYVPAKYFPDVLTALEDVGLRGLLRKYENGVRPIEVDDWGAVEDMDTPTDYERIRTRIANEA